MKEGLVPQASKIKLPSEYQMPNQQIHQNITLCLFNIYFADWVKVYPSGTVTLLRADCLTHIQPVSGIGTLLYSYHSSMIISHTI